MPFPVEFLLFGLTLLGVALFHHRTLPIALCGLVVVVAYKLAFGSFHGTPGLAGLGSHLAHEWVLIVNLACLLSGFALLSRHFEKSHLPLALPKILPDDWKGAFVLLVIVFVLSSFLDNIAGAMIGAAMAHALFARLHVGYLAALVAASNAGGSGSVIGDTTTTMMWIDGVPPGDVVHAYIAASAALVVFGIPAALQQQRFSSIRPSVKHAPHIDWPRLAIVAGMLVAAVATNLVVNLAMPQDADRLPYIGIALWLAILVSVRVRRPDWELLPEAARGATFLLALVLAASMMPVESLPAASWQTSLGLGMVSAVFDNIPLTKLALEQGHYDWGVLAYCVGFGGSMMWFGSSAGVAISNLYPESRSAASWLRHGWHVPLAYLVGFGVLLATYGWHPR